VTTGKAKLDEAVNARDMMSQDHQRMVNELIAARTTKEESNEQIKKLNAQLREATSTHQRVSVEIAAEKKNGMQLQSQWSDLKVENSNLRHQVNQLEMRLATSVMINAGKGSTQADGSNGVNDSDNDGVVAVMNQLKTSLQCAKQQALIAMEEKEQLKARLETLQQKVVNWGMEPPAAAATTEQLDPSATPESSTEVVLATAESTPAANQQLQSKTLHFMRLWQEEQAEGTKLQSQLSAQVANEQSLRHRVDTLEGELESLRKQLSEGSGQVAKLNSQATEKEEKILKLRNLLGHANRKIDELKSMLHSSQENLKHVSLHPSNMFVCCFFFVVVVASI
jgi:chromosome segregation ATPase